MRAAEMSLQVILLFERVFNSQNQSCFLIICYMLQKDVMSRYLKGCIKVVSPGALSICQN